MAILKHVASKNSDYFTALEYLKYQHDEKKGKALRDEYGNLIPREGILLDCDNVKAPETFAGECIRYNRKVNKNTKDSEIKSHHYIISFDPRDSEEGLLDNEKALRIAKKLVQEYLPGHQTLYAVHPDGTNGSGNIHVHVVINSVRKFEIDKQEWMPKSNYFLAGRKHHCGKEIQKLQKEFLMELCQKEGLHQTNLLDPALDKITEKEYWAKVRGEEKAENNENRPDTTSKTTAIENKDTFKTNKEILRSALRSALRKAKSVEEYKTILASEHGITVKESRGVWSYVLAGARPVRARKLGSRYEKAGVEAYIDKQRLKAKKIKPSVEKIIDIESNTKAQESAAYKKKLLQINMERKVKAMALLHQKGIRTEDELTAYIMSAEKAMNEKSKQISELDAELKMISGLSVHRAHYAATREAYRKYKASEDPARYKRAHKAEIEQYESAVEAMNKLKSYYGLKKLPKPDTLEARRKEIAAKQRELYAEIPKLRENLLDLKNTQENLLSILHPEEYKKKMDRQKTRKTEKNAGKTDL